MSPSPAGSGHQHGAGAAGVSDRVHQRARNLFAIDERAHMVMFCQQATGRVLLFLVAVIVVELPYLDRAWTTPWWQGLIAVAAAAGHAYCPRYRAYILFLATYVCTFLWMPPGLVHYAARAAFVIATWIALVLVRQNKHLYFARRPVVSMLWTAFALSAAFLYTPNGGLHSALGAALHQLVTYLWFLAYAIVDQRSPTRSPDLIQLGVMHPFWGSSATPIGKGAAFLRKVLAKTDAELAVTQLKGLKLIIWGYLLSLIDLVLRATLLGDHAIPTVDSAITAFVSGAPYPTAIGWGAIILDTALITLGMAAWGHTIVGIARLAGFRLPRNMCRPLQSRTLIDFWNRYFFYFKELLVDFFYVPTFLKTFRNFPKIRGTFAIFMAAGVGNYLYHVLRDIFLIQGMGLRRAFETCYASYLFYCLALASGIAVSQYRANAGFVPAASWWGRAWSFIVVWGFVVLIRIFGDESFTHTFIERLAFMGSLFGIPT